jgi:hypothetical protein
MSNSLLKKHFSKAAQKYPNARRPCLRPARRGYAQAGEILRVASRRIRSDFLPRRRVGESAEAYLVVRCNKPVPCLTRGRMRETQQMAIFQQPAKHSLPVLSDLTYQKKFYTRHRICYFWRAGCEATQSQFFNMT